MTWEQLENLLEAGYAGDLPALEQFRWESWPLFLVMATGMLANWRGLHSKDPNDLALAT